MQYTTSLHKKAIRKVLALAIHTDPTRTLISNFSNLS